MVGTQPDGSKGIGHRAFALYGVMAKHADFETGDFYASRKTLAGEMGLKKPDAVDEPLSVLKKAGLVTVRPQWKDTANPPTYSLLRDDRFCVPTASQYTLHRAPHSTDPWPDQNRNQIPDNLDLDDEDAVMAWIEEKVGTIEDEATVRGILGSGTYSAEVAARVALSSARKLAGKGPNSLNRPRRRASSDLGGW